ncbi:6783_t:CDS:2 [Diversispora eburnea]|uniref:6783_t:CDS:1 n=1 Tax=Diversispora eburnea TaxID=1213867 RepID=A0A9N9BJ36_9GLOM|nr:6783_t:CDS:2 [Diversispora eburnea]
MSRYNIYAGILEELEDKFIKVIEEKKKLRPVLLALKKYPDLSTRKTTAILTFTRKPE